MRRYGKSIYLRRFFERTFRRFPMLICAQIFRCILAAYRKTYPIILEHSHRRIEFFDDTGNRLYLVFYLRYAAEKMAVILGDGTHAREAAQLAGFFVAIDGRRFEVAHGHVAVAELVVHENLHVVWAVHRLHYEFVFFSLHAEKFIAEFGGVTGRNIERFFRDVRRPYAGISFAGVEFPKIILDRLADDHAFRLDERKSGDR